MLHFRELVPTRVSAQNCVVVMGVFDGVHKGHKYLLHVAKERAKQQRASLVVLTFSDLPVSKLTSTCHRQILLQQAGVDILVEVPLSSILQISALAFLEMMDAMFPIIAWAAGEDVHFGHMRAGDKNVLRQHAHPKGQEVIITERIRQGDDIISSTLIRQAIQRGDVSCASSLLGRPYSFMTSYAAVSPRIWSLHVEALCLPPTGVWDSSVATFASQEPIPAIARINRELSTCDLFVHATHPLPHEVEVVISNKISRLIPLSRQCES